MDIKALFNISCGLYVACVEFEGRKNGLITNTLLEQSHVPLNLSITLEKTHFTHDLIVKKGSVSVSAISDENMQIAQNIIKKFGFTSGRDEDKFAQMPFEYTSDINANPQICSDGIAAVYSLKVYDKIDVGTHTIFLCEPQDMKDLGKTGITYAQYRSAIKDSIKK